MIREIKKEDCNKRFSTGEQKFDTCPYCKEPLTLKFYFTRHDSGEYKTYILEKEKKIVGVMCLQQRPKEIHLNRIGILNGKWKNGHGQTLMKQITSYAISNKATKISCKVHSEAIDWFIGRGFQTVKECKEDNHWGKHAIMELLIEYD